MIIQTIDLLGHRAKDKVTGFEGVISSVSFDLYGCVCAILTPEKNKDGELPGGHYFDISRLEVLPGDPVMQRPAFEDAPPPDEYTHGAAEKPPLSEGF